MNMFFGAYHAKKKEFFLELCSIKKIETTARSATSSKNYVIWNCHATHASNFH
jgi:hypothetical protein